MTLIKLLARFLVYLKLKGTFTASPTFIVAYPYPQAGGSLPIIYDRPPQSLSCFSQCKALTITLLAVHLIFSR